MATTMTTDRIIEDMMDSPLGRQMADRWGWDRDRFAAILDYARSLEAAIRADGRPDGPRARRTKEAFRRAMGATDRDLPMLEYTDRHWQSEGFAASRGVAEQASQAEYVALLMMPAGGSLTDD